MKPIFFKILFSAWLALPMPCAFAQFSVGPDLGFPSGSWSDWGDAGFGASVRYESTIHANLNWTASLGFISFIGRSYNFRVPSATYTNEFISPLTGASNIIFKRPTRAFTERLRQVFFLLTTTKVRKLVFRPVWATG